MRVDLFLKTSRLVKRRTIAQELCESDRALVNGRASKPSKEVKPGDRITLLFNSKSVELEIIALPTSRGKIDPATLYRVIAEKRIAQEDLV